MGGCRCSYKSCKNTTKSTDNMHFFHYPVKHKQRCIQWIENACKPKFYELEEDQLRNKVVCEVHFEERWFPNSQRKRLLQGAIPTLDGDSEEDVKQIPQIPVYASNQYKDVQVLPANDDGTVFVLDSDNMYTKSHKIESYILKNGSLIPSNADMDMKPLKPGNLRVLQTSRPSTSSNVTGLYCNSPDMEIEDVKLPIHVKDELFEEVQNTAVNQERQILNMECRITETNTSEDVHNTVDTNGSEDRRSARPTPQKSFVRRNYLRKIKQHSRDIASIKRLLKQKRIKEKKPDIKTILNTLQEQLPASLFTIVSLTLDEKHDLNDDDVEFFTSVHKCSPEVYQMLSDKYNWNLPNVEEVPGE